MGWQVVAPSGLPFQQCRFRSQIDTARRLWVPKTHLNSPLRLGIYLRYNRLYARETKTKQGMRFGRTAGDLRPLPGHEGQWV